MKTQSAPLSDLIVLDLSRVLSGPFATQQLIDLGATVIKIEHPSRGDDTRGFGPPFLSGESAYFMSINRGKKSVAIDLKQHEGRDLVLELAKKADAALENFRPGTAARLGIGSDQLRAVNPRLITCSISGYGSYGTDEYSRRGGYDAIIQAASGLMSLTGAVDGAPSRVGVAIADLIAGLYAAQGILAALIDRGSSGAGRHLEISMQDAMGAILTYQAGIYFATGESPPRMGDAHPSICPYQSIPTKDGLFMLAVGNDEQFARLVRLLGLEELATDPRFETNSARVENRVALLDLLRPKFAERGKEEWDDALSQAGIPGGPVLDVAQALEHSQLKSRGTILTHSHPRAGEIKSIASPVRWDEEPPSALPAPPVLGQHTAQVLTSMLGLSDNDVADLAARGIVYAP